MYVMLVHITVFPDQIEKFKEIFLVNVEGTRKEPGNVRFDLLQDPKEPHKFSVYEVYLSESAVDDHRKTEHYKKTVIELDKIMSCPRTKEIYNSVYV